MLRRSPEPREALRLRPTFEQIEREARTSRLRILPERQKRTQQGILLDNVDFDEFDLRRYNVRNKGIQTDMFFDSSNYSSASSNRSIRTAEEGETNEQHKRQTSISTGESLDDVRYRTRMSIADDLARMARVGGNIIYYTGQGIGQGINMAVDAYNWWNEEEGEEDVEPPIATQSPRALRDEEVFEQTQGLLRRGASRSRSPEQEEEQASGSNQAMRLMRRGASRSRSSTTPKKGKK